MLNVKLLGAITLQKSVYLWYIAERYYVHCIYIYIRLHVPAKQLRSAKRVNVGVVSGSEYFPWIPLAMQLCYMITYPSS